MLFTFVCDSCEFSFVYFCIILFYTTTFFFTPSSLRTGMWHLLFIFLYLAEQDHQPQRLGCRTLKLFFMLSHRSKTWACYLVSQKHSIDGVSFDE